MPHYLWDYDKAELEKTEQGRILILERKINYGPGDEKIKLSDVKKYWDRLDLYPQQRQLFELLIWDRITPLPRNKNILSIK